MTPNLCTFAQSFPPQLPPYLWKGSPVQHPNLFTKLSDSPVYNVRHSADSLPLDWLFAPKVSATLADRVLARLIQLEAHEPNLHFKSDYRQAFIALSFAGKGSTEPFTLASYTVHGCHPDRVFAKITADRHARLAAEYPDWFDAAGILRPDIPKKPSTLAEAPGTALPSGADLTPIAPASAPAPLSKKASA